MKLDSKGAELLAVCEGLRLKPYLCPAGKPTIGLGNTYYENGEPVKMTDKPITRERALLLFDAIKPEFEAAVNNVVRVPLKQQQFNALFVFAYNVGPAGFKKSTLLKRVNANSGNVAGITEAFLLWKGKKDLLLTRRQKEINEYFRK